MVKCLIATLALASVTSCVVASQNYKCPASNTDDNEPTRLNGGSWEEKSRFRKVSHWSYCHHGNYSVVGCGPLRGESLWANLSVNGKNGFCEVTEWKASSFLSFLTPCTF